MAYFWECPMTLSLSWRVARFLPALLFFNACSSSDRPTAPRSGPEFAISDAVHEGGTPGFYFLPPMVPQPTFSGTFDADVTTLNPQIAICDLTNDANCGASSGTLIVFTTTSTPAITVDLSTPQYQVNWDTQAAGFVTGHTYRVHVTATTGCGARRELGFADVLLTTTSGQVKQLATGDIIVLQDGRTLPIHVRIETGATGDCWTAKASMPTARRALATTAINGILYAVGGQVTGNSFLATVEAYDPATNTWTTKAPMPTARYFLAAAAVNGILYAVGGTNSPTGNSDLATVEAYDPATDTWTTKASMPTARFGLSLTTINGILYAVGGNIANVGPQATVEAYDPVTNTWTTKASMPTARTYLGLAAINGILYAVGGQTNGGDVGTVEAYDPATDTWATKAQMRTVREGLGAGVINGVLYAVGGATGSTAFATLEAYDPTNNTWTTKASMPTARAYLGAEVVNRDLYAVGGNDLVSNLATVEAYQP